SGRRRVEAEETVFQQPNQLVPVLRALGQQLEEGEPEPTVAEHRGHRSSRSSTSNSASIGRRSNAMLPPTALTESWAVPPPATPMRPLADEPQPPADAISGNSLDTLPCATLSFTSRLLSSRTRTVISPLIVSSLMSHDSGGLSRSAVSAPLTVFART